MSDAEDRTQAPSERRQLRAREEGKAPLSRELVTASSLATAALLLALAVPSLARDLAIRLRNMLADAALDPGRALEQAGLAWAASTGPVLVALVLAGMAAVLLQTGFLIHGSAMLPDLARLDPRRGLKRVFGLDNGVEALKALAKLGVLGWAVWSAFRSAWPDVPGSLLWTPETLAEHVARTLLHMVLLVLAAQCGIALLDTAWTRWRFTQRLRMSREDLRQESKESDGDPKVKGRLRQLRLARAKRRMLAAVGKATVVITNPTHYAIALAYERGGSAAPRVVAKGVDDVAARIREAAEKAGVPLVANPPLARALYLVALDAEVPAEHFKLVAEVIAYVWRLRGIAGQRRS